MLCQTWSLLCRKQRSLDKAILIFKNKIQHDNILFKKHLIYNKQGKNKRKGKPQTFINQQLIHRFTPSIYKTLYLPLLVGWYEFCCKRKKKEKHAVRYIIDKLGELEKFRNND